MTIKDNQDYTEKALSRLPNQFIDSPNLRGLVTVCAERMQGMNDEAIKMLDGMSLSTAIGKQLDNLATILNLVRISGESDTEFRARILSETSILAKSGEPSHVIDVYLILTEATSVYYDEIFPAGIQVTAHVAVDHEDADADALIIESMDNVKGGGIGIILVLSPETAYFFFDSEANVDASGNGASDSEGGFGSSSDVDGGKLSRVLKINGGNLIKSSGNMLSSDWNSSTTNSESSEISSDGLSKYTNIEDISASWLVTSQIYSGFSSSKTYNASIYIRKDSIGRETRFILLRIFIYGNTQEFYDISFDTKTGEYLNVQTVNSTVSLDKNNVVIQQYDEHWRISLSAKSSDPLNSIMSVDFYPAVGSGASWTQSPLTNGDCDAAKAQLTEGNNVLPYIESSS